MQTMPFQSGDVMFREGEPSDYVIFVARGEVEVFTTVEGAAVVLGRVGEGQFLGEMAAIEGRPHSATARAASDGAAAVIDAQAFLGQISRQPALAEALLRRLSIRLREADRVIATSRTFGAAAVAAPPEPLRAGAAITLSAATTALCDQIGEAPIPVAHLPFIVGRTPEVGEHSPSHPPDLSLRDHEPLRLSREHFLIERQLGRLWVRDLSSKLGTSVNGQPIGCDFPADGAALRSGENRVVAGGADSPFAFRVTVV